MYHQLWSAGLTYIGIQRQGLSPLTAVHIELWCSILSARYLIWGLRRRREEERDKGGVTEELEWHGRIICGPRYSCTLKRGGNTHRPLVWRGPTLHLDVVGVPFGCPSAWSISSTLTVYHFWNLGPSCTFSSTIACGFAFPPVRNTRTKISASIKPLLYLHSWLPHAHRPYFL
jgi:hypothetical protein